MPPTLLDVAVLVVALLADRPRWRETVLRVAEELLLKDWPSRWNGASVVALLPGLNRELTDLVDRGLAMMPRSPSACDRSEFFLRRPSKGWFLCFRLNIGEPLWWVTD